MSDLEGVIAQYRAWSNAYSQLDVAEMKTLFDQESDSLIYLPEDASDAMFSWLEICAYWDTIPAIIAAIPGWREIDRNVVVGDASATVLAKFDTKILFKDAMRPFEGVRRVLLNMRKGPAGWKLTTLHESRQVDISDLFGD